MMAVAMAGPTSPAPKANLVMSGTFSVVVAGGCTVFPPDGVRSLEAHNGPKMDERSVYLTPNCHAKQFESRADRAL